MADPTLFEIIKSILLPIGLFGIAYFLGTRELRKYQMNKDRNANRKLIYGELAKLYTSQVSFLKAFLDVQSGKIDEVPYNSDQVRINAEVTGLTKLYLKPEDFVKFGKLQSESLLPQVNIKRNDLPLSEEDYKEFTEKIVRYYFMMLEFIKKSEILP